LDTSGKGGRTFGPTVPGTASWRWPDRTTGDGLAPSLGSATTVEERIVRQ